MLMSKQIIQHTYITHTNTRVFVTSPDQWAVNGFDFLPHVLSNSDVVSWQVWSTNWDVYHCSRSPLLRQCCVYVGLTFFLNDLMGFTPTWMQMSNDVIVTDKSGIKKLSENLFQKKRLNLVNLRSFFSSSLYFVDHFLLKDERMSWSCSCKHRQPIITKLPRFIIILNL